jgi:hypothetical protein
MRAHAPAHFLGLGWEFPPLLGLVFGPVNPAYSIRSDGRVTFSGEHNRSRVSQAKPSAPILISPSSLSPAQHRARESKPTLVVERGADQVQAKGKRCLREPLRRCACPPVGRRATVELITIAPSLVLLRI